ncbi:protein mono-ADP-ribosyltransferase PARP6-like isoform X2 [Antedon mediterranea]|uniref:protein mono-ADP-ribosyltransferase PARP6-like isoform X2 n=1 Tax=Antedon mediterranea TaxID=105859 RepID=UPI003AF98EA5
MMEDLSHDCYEGKDESKTPLLLAEQKEHGSVYKPRDEFPRNAAEQETHQPTHLNKIYDIHYLVDGDDARYDFNHGACLKESNILLHKQDNDRAILGTRDETGCYPDGTLSSCGNGESNWFMNHHMCKHEENGVNQSIEQERDSIVEQLSALGNESDPNDEEIDDEPGINDVDEEEDSEEGDSSSVDDDCEDCNDYYQYSDDHNDEDAYGDNLLEEATLHPLLGHDIHSVKLWYGPTAIDVRRFSSLDDVDVDLKLDISFLHHEIASAWSLFCDQPLIVSLNFSSSRYLDGDISKVTVFQPSTREKQVGICVQVRKITECFVSKHWKLYSNSYVESKQMPLASTTPKLTESSGTKKFKNRCQSFQGEEFIPRKKSLKTLFRQKSSSKSNPIEHLNPDELHLLPTLTEAGKTAKTVPSLCHGFLHQVYSYLRNRISSLNEYCVVCDEPHIFQNGYMLKPAVCERELCVFAFQTLGVMRNAAEDIAMGAEVVDLLVAMVSSAVKSKRKSLILDPYPMVVDPTNPKEFAFSPKKKDCAGFQKIEKSLESFISIREMLATGDPANMKKRMDIKDPNSYPLLQWIVSSNRSHIVKLPDSRQIKFMHTPHQFLLMTSPPSKEIIFSKAKLEHGSIFAFHGSHIENWHSILRKGLINASGTKYQLHGAAYGQGIYLSPHSSVSFGYSGMGHGYHRDPNRTIHVTNKKSDCRFLKSKNLTCIALCEVINSRDLKKNGNIWVCTNPDYVCTRFFFVYEDGKVGDLTVDTSQERYSKEILIATQVKTHPKTGKNIIG